MQVDYLLYNEDYKKIEGMLENLTVYRDGLFNPEDRRRMYVADGRNGPEWHNVTCRHLQRLATNVLQYNVTLPSTYPYPELVAAQLINQGWEVKVRYRNADAREPWTYMKCEFPEGTRYALPADWRE
jgi:hypothetical protein